MYQRRTTTLLITVTYNLQVSFSERGARGNPWIGSSCGRMGRDWLAHNLGRDPEEMEGREGRAPPVLQPHAIPFPDWKCPADNLP